MTSSSSGAAVKSNGVLRSRVEMRPKKAKDNNCHRRRISCKDLGGGDCKGWLLKKDGGIWRDRWNKYWFVLKDRNLYYYKHEEDDSYVGRFHLADFIVSPEPGSSHKHAFRVHHDKVGTFLFASDRQSDMAKWMNKLQLASIPAVSNNNNNNRSELRSISEDGSGCHSGGEDDDVDSVTSSPLTSSSTYGDSPSSETTPTGSCSVSMRSSEVSQEDGLGRLMESLRHSRVDVLGDARGVAQPDQRLTHFVKEAAASDDVISAASPAPSASHNRRLMNKSFSQLCALKRTLKDRECELQAIDELLANLPVTAVTLQTFALQHATIVDRLQQQTSESQPTSRQLANGLIARPKRVCETQLEDEASTCF